MISHTNEKNHKCDKCIMSFGYKHHLDRHVRLIHECERLECLLCEMKFIKKKAYNKHIAKLHAENSTQTYEEVPKRKKQKSSKSSEEKVAENDLISKKGDEILKNK